MGRITQLTSGRRLGLKLVIISAMVAILGIPLAFVGLMTWERSERADSANREVGALYGGTQTVRGPFLVVPYSRPHTVWSVVDGNRIQSEEMRPAGSAILSARTIDYDVTQTVTTRRRGIYEVPVYDAEISARGVFSPGDVAGVAVGEIEPDWSAARIIVAVNDLRAFRSPIDMRIGGDVRASDFEPGGPDLPQYWRSVSANLTGVTGTSDIPVDVSFQLSGAAGFRLAASGRDTTASMRSNWPHPGFIGGWLPDSSDISTDGFTAAWTIPYLGRGVPAAVPAGVSPLSGLDQQAFGLQLVTPADGYQQVGRSLKYGLFFIGFLLLMIFLIEVRSRQKIHPAQYFMLGGAQVVFYLLLLALSEQIGSGTGFALAAMATIGLSAFYAASAFASRRTGMVVCLSMAVVYAMQYVLLLVEDYALLVGAVLAFAGLAAAMVLTRRVAWYEDAASARPSPPAV